MQSSHLSMLEHYNEWALFRLLSIAVVITFLICLNNTRNPLHFCSDWFKTLNSRLCVLLLMGVDVGIQWNMNVSGYG